MKYKTIIGSKLNELLIGEIQEMINQGIWKNRFDDKEIYTIYEDGNIDNEAGHTEAYSFVSEEIYLSI